MAKRRHMLLDMTRRLQSKYWRTVCIIMVASHGIPTPWFRCSHRYEQRIAELRIALDAPEAAPAPEQQSAPEPAPEPNAAPVGLTDPRSNASVNGQKKHKQKTDKGKGNRSKSKDRSRRRSDRRSSSRRRSSGDRERHTSSISNGDEEPAARLTDAEWRSMWGLHSQVTLYHSVLSLSSCQRIVRCAIP